MTGGWGGKNFQTHSQGKRQMVDQEGPLKDSQASQPYIPIHKQAQHAKSKRLSRQTYIRLDRHISVRLAGFRLSVTCDRLKMDRLLSAKPITHWEL